MSYNRFDQLSTLGLIKGIQYAAMQLADKKFVKETSTGKRAKILADLNQMRVAVYPRLKEMDRTSPKFFPKGAHVSYKRRLSAHAIDDFDAPAVQPEKFGVVVDHDTTRVLVQFEREQFFVRVDPLDLKIRFIR